MSRRDSVAIGNRHINRIKQLRATTLRILLVAFLSFYLSLDALAIETEQSELARIAKGAKGGLSDINGNQRQARKNAIMKLTSQILLFEVAIDANDAEISLIAVNKLTGQNMLFRVASQAKHGDSRAAALEKVTEKSLLDEVTTQNKLKNIFSEDKHRDVRIAALRKIGDQAFLAKVAMAKLQDADIIKVLYKAFSHSSFNAALEEVKDEKKLKRIQDKRQIVGSNFRTIRDMPDFNLEKEINTLLGIDE